MATYNGSVAYATDGLSQALKAVAGAIVRGIGTKVFWVQIGGFDTHATQGTNAANGALRQPDGHAEHRAHGVLHRSARTRACCRTRSSCSSRSSAGASAKTAAPAPTTARPRVMFAMGGNVTAESTARRRSSIPLPATADAREQRQRRHLRNGLPLRLRADYRQLAGREFRVDSRWGFQEDGA